MNKEEERGWEQSWKKLRPKAAKLSRAVRCVGEIPVWNFSLVGDMEKHHWQSVRARESPPSLGKTAARA